MCRKIILCLLVTFVVVGASSAQKAWKKPSFLDNPEYNRDENTFLRISEDDYAKHRYKGDSKSKEDWLVFIDRDGVSGYKTNSAEPSKKIKEYRLGEVLKVIGEKGDFLEVADPINTSTGQAFVLKSELVLWSNPLLNYETKIDLKAFIINRNDQGWLNDLGSNPSIKDVYQIFSAPTGTDLKDPGRQIYDVLFVYKIDPKNKRVLVGDKYSISDGEGLLGWVADRRIDYWETAVALEPNFNDGAHKYRKNNPDKQVQVFWEKSHALSFASGNEVHESNVLIGNSCDPASAKNKHEGLVSGNRFVGKLPRFPLYSKSNEVLRCGVIAETNMGNLKNVKGEDNFTYARLEEELKKRSQDLANINVVFVLDATPGMNRYRQLLKDAMHAIDDMLITESPDDIRFGVVAYRDAYCSGSPGENLVQVKSLTNDREEIELFLNGIEIKLSGPDDGYESVYYGLMSALRNCIEDDDKYHVNIVYHLGSSGDFEGDMMRYEECDAEWKINSSAVGDRLAELRAHYIVLQCVDRGDDPHREFRAQIEDLITRSTRKISGIEAGVFAKLEKDAIKAPSPVSTGNRFFMENSPTVATMHSPKEGEDRIDDDRVVKIVASYFEEARDNTTQRIELMSRLFNDNSTVDGLAPEFGSAVTSMLNGLDQELIDCLAENRVQLYTEAYTAYEISGMPDPMWSYVLFMPKDRAMAIRKGMKDMYDAYKVAEPSEYSKLITELWVSFTTTFLNIDSKRHRRFLEDQNINDLVKKMNGVEDLDIEFGGCFAGISMETIEKMTDEQKKQVFECVGSKIPLWDEILNNETFMYRAGDSQEKWYWIPADLVL